MSDKFYRTYLFRQQWAKSLHGLYRTYQAERFHARCIPADALSLWVQFGLIERSVGKKGKPARCYWQFTEPGIAFVVGSGVVPDSIKVFEGKVVGSGEPITLADAFRLPHNRIDAIGLDEQSFGLPEGFEPPPGF